MNWPSSVIVRGIQICWPKHLVIRLASVVLPLPGAPYKNMPAPEFTAGPSESSSSGSMLIPRNAAVSCSRRAASARIVCASTLIT